jgi:hypothetical protein
MDSKRLVTGTVVGGVVLFATGYLFWDVLFGSFFEAHAGSAAALETPVLWAAILAHLFLGALYTLGIDWSGASSAMDGFKIGAIMGFLVWGGVDLLLFAYFGFSDLTGTFADIGLEFVRTGITGAVIVAALGMMGGSAASE